MLNILLMITFIIIIFIIFLLYIGIKVSLDYVKKGSKITGCFKILIFKKIKIYSLEYPHDEDKEDDEDREDIDIKELFELAKPCFKHLKEFLNSFLNSIKVKKLDNHIVFGMDSYADTGKYIGIIWGLLAMINSVHEKARLSAEPSFQGSVLDSYGHGEVDINILKLIFPTLRLISKKEIRDLIRGVING